jgi:hypothetical protein
MPLPSTSRRLPPNLPTERVFKALSPLVETIIFLRNLINFIIEKRRLAYAEDSFAAALLGAVFLSELDFFYFACWVAGYLVEYDLAWTLVFWEQSV